MIDLATKIIKLDEESGVCALIPYYCSEQYPTIGWGFRIGEKYAPLPDITITLEEANNRLAAMLKKYHKQLSEHINTRHIYPKLNPVRQAVLLSMRHQLGMDGLIDFRKMWIGIESQDWKEAAAQILDSKAYKQAPARFVRNAQMMRLGELMECYK